MCHGHVDVSCCTSVLEFCVTWYLILRFMISCDTSGLAEMDRAANAEDTVCVIFTRMCYVFAVNIQKGRFTAVF